MLAIIFTILLIASRVLSLGIISGLWISGTKEKMVEVKPVYSAVNNGISIAILIYILSTMF